jgi:hypothetical protein
VISRRSFFIGSAAFVATTLAARHAPVLNAAVGRTTLITVPMSKLPYREIDSLVVAFDCGEDAPNQAALISLYAPAWTWRRRMNVVGCLIWKAVDVNERLVIDDKRGFQVDVLPDPSYPMKLVLMSNIEKGGHKFVEETVVFHNTGTTWSRPIYCGDNQEPL